MDWLFAEEVTSVVLSAGYLAPQFADALQRTQNYGGRVLLVTEPDPAGTGGALRYVKAHLQDQFFCSTAIPCLRSSLSN
ncbi:MAG: hypothetical protein A2527_04260 [Candidatus Lambdaproteobacteria bacterium RIFOXYD2_FULL_50_16]|uniref:Nucleotidyl transferase domain-containing protein n=1 Tax=Candidatus Lambdaproteobacteria bacterium RIFOXYD2_FULL_50_16 TaxID=1817772 RepID=A0A1F6G4B0_9PROT|nr:MAG: hypothetical protein A2527_04260 [Candidatus Lambdaproteobacteria bacterium RIFOXYD2_FULL_50_16]